MEINEQIIIIPIIFHINFLQYHFQTKQNFLIKITNVINISLTIFPLAFYPHNIFIAATKNRTLEKFNHYQQTVHLREMDEEKRRKIEKLFTFQPLNV